MSKTSSEQKTECLSAGTPLLEHEIEGLVCFDKNAPADDILSQAAAFIKPFEGFMPTLYRCPGGKPTIGYGHVIKKNEQFPQVLREFEADCLLKQDLVAVKKRLDVMVEVPLTVPQEIALLSFLFNVGSTAFFRSTLRQKLNRGLHEDVVDEFARWKWAGGQIQRGLVRRRAHEAALYESGILADDEEGGLVDPSFPHEEL